jgi:hypothetical protein
LSSCQNREILLGMRIGLLTAIYRDYILKSIKRKV